MSFLRVSQSKSNIVASIAVVSSIETLSTQSKVSPIGRESRISMARSRTMGSSTFRLRGEETGWATFL